MIASAVYDSDSEDLGELAPEEVRRLRAATDATAREKEQRFHQE